MTGGISGAPESATGGAQPRLTGPQQRALAHITERGYVGPGNRVTLRTVRVLERHGLVTVETRIARDTLTWKPFLDWLARPAEPVPGTGLPNNWGGLEV